MAVLHKKLLRSLLRSWAESLAVVMVVLCGTASFICMHSCYLNLRLTRDTYYARNRLADFEIMLERAPANAVFKVEEIPGVRQARARMVKDVNVDIEGVDEPRVGRIVSMPQPRRPVLNDVVVMEGQYFNPGAVEEVILSDRFARENGLRVGDAVSVSVEQRKYRLRIVGLGLSLEVSLPRVELKASAGVSASINAGAGFSAGASASLGTSVPGAFVEVKPPAVGLQAGVSAGASSSSHVQSDVSAGASASLQGPSASIRIRN